MDATERAVQVLREAEGKLAGILRDSVEARAYQDLAGVAAISARLAEVISEWENCHVLASSASRQPLIRPRKNEAPTTTSTPAGKETSRGRSRRPTGYPRFGRDGDRLVKIGWSKKEEVEYEHRAPHAAVQGVIAALRTTADREFSMDDLFPIKGQEGAEIPSYQAYMVLAWLRSIGAVRKASRGGYVGQAQRLEPDEVQAAWDAMSSVGNAETQA